MRRLSAAPGAAARPRGRAGLLLLVLAILAASAVTGLAAGIAWALLAPRPLYQLAGGGVAYVVNPETSAFIVADAWYCLIGAVGGLLIGAGGFWLAVRRHGPVPMAAVLAGSIGAAFAARWAGQSWGLGPFDRQLASGRAGLLVHAPLVLGGADSAILWPAIAFWPLGACLAAGTLLLLLTRRERAAVPPAGTGPAGAGPWPDSWPPLDPGGRWPGRGTRPGAGPATRLGCLPWRRPRSRRH